MSYITLFLDVVVPRHRGRWSNFHRLSMMPCYIISLSLFIYLHTLSIAIHMTHAASLSMVASQFTPAQYAAKAPFLVGFGTICPCASIRRTHEYNVINGACIMQYI